MEWERVAGRWHFALRWQWMQQLGSILFRQQQADVFLRRQSPIGTKVWTFVASFHRKKAHEDAVKQYIDFGVFLLQVLNNKRSLRSVMNRASPCQINIPQGNNKHCQIIFLSVPVWQLFQECVSEEGNIRVGAAAVITLLLIRLLRRSFLSHPLYLFTPVSSNRAVDQSAERATCQGSPLWQSNALGH